MQELPVDGRGKVGSDQRERLSPAQIPRRETLPPPPHARNLSTPPPAAATASLPPAAKKTRSSCARSWKVLLGRSRAAGHAQ